MKSFQMEKPGGTALAQVCLVALSLVLLAWNVGAGLLIFFVFLLPIISAIELGQSRQRTGWMWGLFLNWLGVLILACMRAQPTERS